MRRLACFVGWHNPQIIRIFTWGNVHRAELRCVCGKRFEGAVFGNSNHGYVVAAPKPSELWRAYDDGAFRE